MGENDTESCGRCAMSTTSELLDEPDDPYEGGIEIDEEDARRVSPAAWLEGVKARLDGGATRLTYGR